MRPMIRPDMAKLAAFLTAPDREPTAQAASDLAKAGVAKRQGKTARVHDELRRAVKR